MSGWTLSLRQALTLRIDLRGITPNALAGLSAAQVEQLPIGHGNRLVPLAEFFTVAPAQAEGLRLEGDLSRADRIGWGMDGGTLVVAGNAGHYVGGGMASGSLRVEGSTELLTGCELRGGTLEVAGDVGEQAGGTLPGSMSGMSGGLLAVRGNAGARFGDRMRRGTALVFGDAARFLASRMVAGTIAVGGRAGPHAGYGMRRGSVVLATAAPDALVESTFVPAIADAGVFWQLLARDLARHGGPFAALPARRIERHLGDLSAGGKGELIFLR